MEPPKVTQVTPILLPLFSVRLAKKHEIATTFFLLKYSAKNGWHKNSQENTHIIKRFLTNFATIMRVQKVTTRKKETTHDKVFEKYCT